MNSFESLALKLQRSEAMISQLIESSLEASAQIVEDTAKAEFGIYQPRIGPFEAWQPLAESTMDQRVRLGFTPNDPLLRTGHLRDTITHDVSDNEAFIGSDDDIMVKQELGTHIIPPRAVLGPAGMRTEKEIHKLIQSAIVEVFNAV